MRYTQHKTHLRLFLKCFMHRERPHVVWRQHKTLTSNMAQTGHTRALDNEHDNQVTHGDLDHNVCVHITKTMILPNFAKQFSKFNELQEKTT